MCNIEQFLNEVKADVLTDEAILERYDEIIKHYGLNKIIKKNQNLEESLHILAGLQKDTRALFKLTQQLVGILNDNS